MTSALFFVYLVPFDGFCCPLNDKEITLNIHTNYTV